MAVFFTMASFCLLGMTIPGCMVAGKPPTQSMHLTKNGHTWTASQKSSLDDNILTARHNEEVVVFNGVGGYRGIRDSEECSFEDYDENVNSKSFNNSHKDSKSMAPRKILGNQDRRIPVKKITSADDPYNAIVYIDHACTGFFVGPKHILTAGHCVYNYKKRKQGCERRGFYRFSYAYRAKQCTCDPCDEDKDYCFEMESYIIFEKYFKTKSRSYDIALIIVDKESDVVLDLGWKTGSLVNTDVSVSGYPVDKKDYCMYTSTGTITKELNYEISHNCDAVAGMSGGPIYNKQDKRVYGIHTGYDPSQEMNIGVKITKSLYVEIHDWINTMSNN